MSDTNEIRILYYFCCLHSLLRACQDAENQNEEIDSVMRELGARMIDDCA